MVQVTDAWRPVKGVVSVPSSWLRENPPKCNASPGMRVRVKLPTLSFQLTLCGIRFSFATNGDHEKYQKRYPKLWETWTNNYIMSQQVMSSRKSNIRGQKETMIDALIFRLLPCSVKKMVLNFRQLGGSEKSSSTAESTSLGMFSTFSCSLLFNFRVWKRIFRARTLQRYVPLQS